MKYGIIFCCVALVLTSAWAVNATCIETPSMPECVSFKYPNPGAVVDTMCGMMSEMPTCSVRERVCKDKHLKDTHFCADFSLMADVCTDMVMGVQGCKDYRSMCSNVSVIAECSDPSLKAVLPTYVQTKSYVTSICNSMPMDGCEKCQSGTCDFLSVYSNLCLAMPGMTECTHWKSFCSYQNVNEWPFCPGYKNPFGPPEMRMYFHTGLADYVLFKTWVPRNNVQYAFTWLAIALAGILLEALKFGRARLEKRWARLSHNLSVQQQEHFDFTGKLPWKWSIDIPRAILQTIELAWGYLLMLVAMTFNVGLFFAVLAGCFIGTLLFGRFLVSLPKVKTASCH